MKTSFRTPSASRAFGLTTFALAALVLTAQSPAPGVALPWCTTIPLPRAALPAMTVDAQMIHRAHTLSCRSLDVPTPRRTVQLAVAATESEREHGLMDVPYVPSGEGMLFAFPDAADERRYFWMKNTIATLDMVFVKGDGTISFIADNVPATTFGQSDDKVARRDGVGRYVIELGAGESARLGLQPGMRLEIPSIPAK